MALANSKGDRCRRTISQVGSGAGLAGRRGTAGLAREKDNKYNG
jgi:hypothetical protein